MNYVFTYSKKYLLIFLIILIFAIKFKYYSLSLLIIFCIFCLFYFFRRPDIKIKNESNNIYAPASGKIIKILDHGNVIQIAIFINLWDAHIQYIPYNGIILDQIYKKGKFNAAYIFKKGKDNERLIHYIQTNKGIITVIQIAGVMVRNIVTFKKPKDMVKQCEELGLIKFGSSTQIFIPKNSTNDKLLIKEGDIVKGGETIIYTF